MSSSKQTSSSITQPTIVFVPPKRTVNKVFLHCSASDRPEDDDVSIITHWHVLRGFQTVGYHYFIRKDGLVQKGRDLEVIPAAQQGYNTGSIAICVHGLIKSKFTDASLLACKELCEQINKAYGGKVTFHGHREVNKQKTCPVFDYKVLLQLDTRGRMKNAIIRD